MTSEHMPPFLDLPHKTWRGLLAIHLMAVAVRLDVRLIHILSQRAVWASGWRPTGGASETGRAPNGLAQTWTIEDP